MMYYIEIKVDNHKRDSVKSPCIPRIGEMVFTSYNKYKVLHVAYSYKPDDTLEFVILGCEVI